MLLRVLVSVFMVIVISSCSMPNRVNVIKNGAISQGPRTIRTTPGAGGMLGVVKQVLSEKNWKMVALSGPERTVGKLSNGEVDVANYTAASADYILYVDGQFINYQCNPSFQTFAGQPLTSHYVYSVSIVDWRSGDEVVTISGSGCLYDIVENLRKNIPY